jgi:hypothetical protein
MTNIWYYALTAIVIAAVATTAQQQCCVYTGDLTKLTEDKGLALAAAPTSSCVAPYAWATCAAGCSTLKCAVTYKGVAGSVHAGLCGQTMTLASANMGVASYGGKNVSCAYVAGVVKPALASTTNTSSASLTYDGHMAATLTGFLVVPSILMAMANGC